MFLLLSLAPDGATIAWLLPSASLAVISAKTHLLDHVKINSILQLINGIFNARQTLLNCFSRITTFTSVNGSLFSGVFPIIFFLYLKDLELEERGLLGSFL